MTSAIAATHLSLGSTRQARLCILPKDTSTLALTGLELTTFRLCVLLCSARPHALWKAMEHLGYPSKIVRFLQALYKTSTSAVRVNQELTDWFPTHTGVRHGCILSHQQFKILLELVLRLAIEDVQVGIQIQGQIINSLRFTDDIVLLAPSENDLQTLVNQVQEWSKKFQVQIISKESMKINIKINGKELEQVDSFVYLGWVITEKSSSEGDIRRRIGLATGIMQTFSAIWNSSEISTQTKLELCRVLVLFIGTYGCETWTLKK